MNTEIIFRGRPEEDELQRKREELARLQSQLVERELFLLNLRTELSTFERRYLRLVGPLYTELDEWNRKTAEWLRERGDADQSEKWRKKIAELLAEPTDWNKAQFVHPQSETADNEFDSAICGEPEDEPFIPSPGLKSLYREVAKRVHPDLAVDDADKEERQRVMAEANAAYQSGDIDALRRILEDYKEVFDSVVEKGLAAGLAHVSRQIRQAQRRLLHIEEEIRDLNESELGTLKTKAEEAAHDRRDLLAEIAGNLRKRIQGAQHRYETYTIAARES